MGVERPASVGFGFFLLIGLGALAYYNWQAAMFCVLLVIALGVGNIASLLRDMKTRGREDEPWL